MKPFHTMAPSGASAVAGALRRTEGIAVWRGCPPNRAGRVRLPGSWHQPATQPAEPKAQTSAAIEPREVSPQDVWWRLEDLWLRLARHCTVRVEQDGDNHSLVVGGFRHAQGGEFDELRSAVFDDASYHWNLGGEHGALVALIAYRGDDLFFMLTPTARMATWPDGTEVAAMVQGFLSSLRLRQSATWWAAA
ncbi:MAG: hypothetical protein IPJ08_09200 [Burkholderiales bacterium]|nr:hypothetical protein [Burkholderiales bacterium]